MDVFTYNRVVTWNNPLDAGTDNPAAECILIQSFKLFFRNADRVTSIMTFDASTASVMLSYGATGCGSRLQS
ncbi:MAG: hypothetical protein R2758_00050 [Bacteroidales bacterium]